MKKNFVLLTVFVFIASIINISSAVGASLPIIPGQNVNLYGMSTTAGSGRHLGTPDTTICKVVNLNDSGSVDTDDSDGVVSGSLRYCLQNDGAGNYVEGPKVVIFEVSGTIALQDPIKIGDATTGKLCDSDPATVHNGITVDTGNYITVAGQTAPSPGILLRNYGIKIERNCHDILIQHIRIRVGDDNPGNEDPEYIDAVTVVNSYSVSDGWYPPYNIVFDHNSFSWSVDEMIETGGNNTTYMNNIISEPLFGSIHTKSGGMEHSKGLVQTGFGPDGQYETTIVTQNLFAHGENRGPKVSSGRVVFTNNVSYDFKEPIRLESVLSNKADVHAAVAGNYLYDGDSQLRTIYVISEYDSSKSNTEFYVADGDPDPANYYSGQLQTDPWNTMPICGDWGNCSASIEPSKVVYTAPQWPSGYTAMSAADARTYVLANAGARPTDRDAVDTRIINKISAATEPVPFNPVDCVDCSNADCTGNDIPRECCTGVGTGNCRAAPGGWPNLVENRRTLTLPPNPHEVQPSGYTKLEEWLREFAATVERSPSPPQNLRIISP